MGSDLQRLKAELSAAIAGLDEQGFSTRVEGKWCITEVLEHLYLSYTGTIKGFERCLERGKPLARAAKISDLAKIFVVTRLNYFPSGRKSPKQAEPKGTPATQFVTGIPSTLGVLDETISHCEKQFGKNRRLLDHPILGPLTGDEWRKFHLVHGRHHIKQIQQLRSVGR